MSTKPDLDRGDPPTPNVTVSTEGTWRTMTHVTCYQPIAVEEPTPTPIAVEEPTSSAGSSAGTVAVEPNAKGLNATEIPTKKKA
jgi:hypothetical protein